MGRRAARRVIRPRQLPMHLTDLIDVALVDIEWEDLSRLEIALQKRIAERRASKIRMGLPVRKANPKRRSHIVGKIWAE